MKEHVSIVEPARSTRLIDRATAGEKSGSASTSERPAMIVADVGGTNARFACARWLPVPGGGLDGEQSGHPRGRAPGMLHLEHVLRVEVADHPSAEAAVRRYVEHAAQASARAGQLWRAPTALALAVASPIQGDQVKLTNGPWSFSQTALRQALGMDRLRVLNDFEALALALPHLRADQWLVGRDGPRYEGVEPHAGSPSKAAEGGGRQVLAVVGPGTGLGVGAVAHTDAGWQALAGEGGHATLAAADDFEAAVIASARNDHAHVSAERLLSGTGLPTLHRAVASVMGYRLATGESLSPEVIVEQGLARSDVVCDRTLDVFCALLGGFCGNVALTYGSRAALFVGGGIVPRLGERFFASTFRARFEGKGRYRDYLSTIPTPLITDTMAALTGAAWALQCGADG